MNTLFNFIVVFEVLSVRVPVVNIKMVYILQLLLVPLFLVTLRNHATWPGTHRNALTFIKMQFALLVAVCIPLLIQGNPDPRTLNYTAGLAALVLAFSILFYRIRIAPIKFLRLYTFSVFILLALSLPAYFVLSDQRLDSFFGGGTNRMGLYSVIGILISYYVITRKLEHKKYRAIYIFGLCTCLASLTLTFSRSALLALFLAIVEHNVRNKTLKISHALIGLVVVVGAAFYMNYVYTQTGDERYLKLMIRFGINELLGHSTFDTLTQASRLDHWQSALELVNDTWFTVIFGVGLESYRSADFLTNTRGSDLALHSIYLQYYAGGGLLAISILIAFIVKQLTICYSLSKTHRDLCCFFLIPSIVHAAFQPAIFSKELLLFSPLLLLSCKYISIQSERKTRANQTAYG